MKKLLIKVCGMRDPFSIREVMALAPDFMGFIFYPASPRYIGEMPDSSLLSEIPAGINKTGVFVNADRYEIKAAILKYGINTIQLHGDESPESCRAFKSAGMKVIKAFKIDTNTDFGKMKYYTSCTDWFLFDSNTKSHGGSGIGFNWELLDKYKLGHPFFLSGGIGPSDAKKIFDIKHPAFAGVDLNSRFETEPGVKDAQKLKVFIEKLHQPSNIKLKKSIIK